MQSSDSSCTCVSFTWPGQEVMEFGKLHYKQLQKNSNPFLIQYAAWEALTYTTQMDSCYTPYDPSTSKWPLVYHTLQGTALILPCLLLGKKATVCWLCHFSSTQYLARHSECYRQFRERSSSFLLYRVLLKNQEHRFSSLMIPRQAVHLANELLFLTEQAGQNKVAERKTKQDCIHHNKEESQKYSISKLLPIRKHEERNEWVKESYQWSLEWIINMNVLNEQQKGTSLGSHCSNCLVYKHYEETPTIYTILKKEILLILWSPGHIG